MTITFLQLYIPRDLWSGLEKMMAVKLLHSKVESCVDKLLKVRVRKKSTELPDRKCGHVYRYRYGGL